MRGVGDRAAAGDLRQFLAQMGEVDRADSARGHLQPLSEVGCALEVAARKGVGHVGQAFARRIEEHERVLAHLVPIGAEAERQRRHVEHGGWRGAHRRDSFGGGRSRRRRGPGCGHSRRPLVQGARNHREQQVRRDRLGDEFVHSASARARLVVASGVGGQCDDHRVAQARVGADHARCFEAVHDRHLQIHQHAIEAAPEHQGDCLPAVVGDHHGGARLF